MYSKNEVFESPFYIRVKERNRMFIMQVLKNNAYLLKQINKTLADQLRDIETTGVKLKRDFILKLRNGERLNCQLSYLSFFAEYWQLSIAEMASFDFAENEITISRVLNFEIYGLWKHPKTKSVKTNIRKVVLKYP